jgi:hypothetical protein
MSSIGCCRVCNTDVFRAQGVAGEFESEIAGLIDEDEVDLAEALAAALHAF